MTPTPTAAAATPTPASTASPRPTFAGGAITLPGGWMLGAAPGPDGFWLWDRTRGAYRPVPYDRVYPAPVGGYAVVVDRIDERVGVLDVATDEVRWLPGRRLWHGPEWTADGRRFLMTDQTAGSYALIVDARTGRQQTMYGAPAVGDVPAFWMPGDRQVAAWIDGSYWQLYDAATGERGGRLEEMAGVSARTDFSPDGRWVVCGRGAGGPAVLRDAATGRGRAVLPPLTPGRTYWADSRRVLVLDGPRGMVVLADLDGRDLARFDLPDDMDVDEGHTYTLIRS